MGLKKKGKIADMSGKKKKSLLLEKGHLLWLRGGKSPPAGAAEEETHD